MPLSTGRVGLLGVTVPPVPGVFAPTEVNGRVLGDGGLVDNLPIDVARAMGADVLIVVNIGTPIGGRDTLNSLVGVTTQMIAILTEQNVQRSLATLKPSDVLIAPKLEGITSADFNRTSELIGQGQLQTEAFVFRLGLDSAVTLAIFLFDKRLYLVPTVILDLNPFIT